MGAADPRGSAWLVPRQRHSEPSLPYAQSGAGLSTGPASVFTANRREPIPPSSVSQTPANRRDVGAQVLWKNDSRHSGKRHAGAAARIVALIGCSVADRYQ